jgi:ABC-2 type transport system ATP-binding protein
VPKPAITITNASVTLDHHFKALDAITVELPAGRVIGFIGPSGAGKTTLMRAIVGRQKLSGGSISVFSLPAGSPRLRHQISYMTQETSIYSDLTVAENLRYFARMYGLKPADIAPQISRILGIVDLSDKAGQLVDKLSGGQKQRVSLAVALIGNPPMMVLDEPTVGLDPLLREQLWSLFRELARGGTTLIISSHVMDEAERCDELLLIRDGKMLAHGSPKALTTRTHSSSVEQSFLKLVGGTS